MKPHECFLRFGEMLVGREHGPLTFRLIIQSLAAVILALRIGLRDARDGASLSLLDRPYRPSSSSGFVAPPNLILKLHWRARGTPKPSASGNTF